MNTDAWLRLPQLTMLLVLLQLSGPLAAETLTNPSGKIILTVSGKIRNTNAGDRALFDLQMLESLGVTELETTTPWTDGRQKFSGVLGSKVLDAVGAAGNALVARAINDYQVTIPVSDLRRYPVLFALKRNGRYLRVRGKGPIWIIYPHETYPELAVVPVMDRWIWQLSVLSIQ